MTEKPKASNGGTKSVVSVATDAAFRLQDLYPDAAALFAHTHPTVEEIKQTCIVVLDASVLLYAYELKSESFEEIGKLYGRLRDENRLVVPGQSAREFFKIRPSKVASIVERIDATLSNIEKNPFPDKINLLAKNQNYIDAKSISADIVNKAKELRSSLTACKSELEAGIGSDPVSTLYRELLTSSVVELEIPLEARSDFVKELEWRNRMQIAPGYTDSAKPDGGSGDLLIWHTLLMEASKRQVDCIFITEERKEDWWVKSKGSSFQPRPELIDEYRRRSGGRSLFLMPLSAALLNFAVEDGIVEEVQDIEQLERDERRYRWDSGIYAIRDLHIEAENLDGELLSISREIRDVEASIENTINELEQNGKYMRHFPGYFNDESRRDHQLKIDGLHKKYGHSLISLSHLRDRQEEIRKNISDLQIRIKLAGKEQQ